VRTLREGIDVWNYVTDDFAYTRLHAIALGYSSSARTSSLAGWPPADPTIPTPAGVSPPPSTPTPY